MRLKIACFKLGLATDTIDLPCYIQHLIAGKRQQQLQTIMEETGTNIYLQSPFLKLSDLQHMTLPVDQRGGVIHLTGSPNGIQRAKDLLRKLAVQKVNLDNVCTHEELILDIMSRKSPCITKSQS